ncbi:MAG TPA: HrpE/YscL family type III secretion apparatus protein [Opitutales bacterium]|nr:HrpE/YscL family type III secretion apparatus protein [Opitutales bacterium]
MLRIKDNGQLIPEGKIIRAEEYATWVEAKDIRAEAEDYAQRKKAQALKDYKSEKQRGFEEGVEEGKAQAVEHMMSYVSRAVDSFGSFEEKIVTLVMQAIKQIIGEVDDQELIRRVVIKALEPAKSQKRVIIRVAPQQTKVIDAQVEALKEKFRSIDYIDIVRDERLKPGDCTIETDVGVIDGRMEVQLAAVKRSLDRIIK